MEGEADEVSAQAGPVVIPDSCPPGKHPFRSRWFLRGREGWRDPSRKGTPLLLGYRGG